MVHSTATSTSAVNSTGSRSGAESPVGAAVGAVLGVLAAVTIIVTILVVIFVLWRKNSIQRSDGTIANPTYEGMYGIIIGLLLYCFCLFMTVVIFMMLYIGIS